MSHLIKMSSIFLLLVLMQEITLGQEKTHEPRRYLGGTLGTGFYTQSSINQIPVSPFYKHNGEVGINVLFDFSEDFFLKTGLYTTSFRSPFENNISIFDEFLKIPVLFSMPVSKIKENSNFVISTGPQISLLTRQGKASMGDEHYTMTSNSFGQLYKLGFAGEMAVYTKTNKCLHAYGLYFSIDIPSLYFKTHNDIVVNNRYIATGLFYSLMR